MHEFGNLSNTVFLKPELEVSFNESGSDKPVTLQLAGVECTGDVSEAGDNGTFSFLIIGFFTGGACIPKKPGL